MISPLINIICLGSFGIANAGLLKKSYEELQYLLVSLVKCCLCNFEKFHHVISYIPCFIFNHSNTSLHHVLADGSIHLTLVHVLISKYLLNKSILL